MNTAIITVRIDSQTKREAQELAKRFGLPLSGILNALVKQFIRQKKLNLSLADEPSNVLATTEIPEKKVQAAIDLLCTPKKLEDPNILEVFDEQKS